MSGRTAAVARRLRHFYSDNTSCAHPLVVQSILTENSHGAHEHGYGHDAATARTKHLIRHLFGGKDSVNVYPMWSGTGANVLSIAATCRSPHESVICANTSHLYVDECGAPERHCGVKLVPISTEDGKIRPHQLEQHLPDGDFHHTQPRVLSITQATECGTIYSREEIRQLADLVHKHDMFLHMDGARLYNAAATLNCSLKELTVDVGVDVLSLGGTKNGCLGAEAVVTFRPELQKHFDFYQKQAMQTPSKMRFVSCQLEALLTDNLWLKNASRANEMAVLLRQQLQMEVPSIRFAYPTEANSVWVTFPMKQIIDFVEEEVSMCLWSEKTLLTRLVCNYDTTEDDVHHLVARIKAGYAKFSHTPN